LIKGARALNSGKPFVGERLLHRLLDNTYFAHILPPLPEPEESKQSRFEEEMHELLGKGSSAMHTFSGWVTSLRESFSNKDKK
jgi:oleate hydratase